MSLLTTAQLTFCDLKDSYSINVDTECIGVVCDNNGMASEKQTATINYRAFAGSTRVGVSCDVYDIPDGVTLARKTPASSAKDGVIEFIISDGATLNNEVTTSVKIVFTTLDADQFTFEKYITFVKSMSGHDGTDAIDFQIYSVDGFEFSDRLESIKLKTIVLHGGSVVTSGAYYQWFWWNRGSTLDDKYEAISGATSPELTVNIDDTYALASLKCQMTYDNIVYEDYVSLVKQTPVCTAMAKFFHGNNIITNDKDYIIAYIELYKDNTPEESLYADDVYISSANAVQNNIITTNLEEEHVDGDMLYFVCEKVYNEMPEYDVVLGVLNSNQWHVVENKYTYKNNLFSHSTSNVVFIPKEKIPGSLNIDFEIHDNSTIIARTNTVVLDLNDPLVSNTAPKNPKNGQLWLDTNVSPSVLKMWDGSQWVNSGYQNGNVVYTSQPVDGYSKGDLWILSDDDGSVFKDFGAGTMLKANVSSSIFDISHWDDVDEEATEQKKNIKQYFLFNADTGLRIGQTNDRFYVNISSSRMSFCDSRPTEAPEEEEAIDPNEVVSISNRSATIKSLTVKEGAVFDCPEIQLGNFVLKIEDNKSLSLAIST